MTFRDFIGLGWLRFSFTLRWHGKQKRRGD